jgi:hypothetical protein
MLASFKQTFGALHATIVEAFGREYSMRRGV